MSNDGLRTKTGKRPDSVKQMQTSQIEKIESQ